MATIRHAPRTAHQRNRRDLRRRGPPRRRSVQPLRRHVGSVQHFAYDLAGNRLRREVDFVSTATLDQLFVDTFDANDRQQTSTETAGTSIKTTTFAYDRTQVVSKMAESGGTVLGGWTYAWDAAGRLAVVGELDGTGLKSRTTYGYDPTGIRISATTESQFTGSVAASTVRTEFLVDHANFTSYQQVIRETHADASETLQRTVDYTFGHDEISQTSIDFTNGQPGEPVTLTFAHDGHGSVRALFDAAGAIATISGVRQLFAFDAYGNALGFTPAQAATTLLYSGEQFDQRAQMQYLRARYYDSSTGRFVGLDPFAGNSRNRNRTTSICIHTVTQSTGWIRRVGNGHSLVLLLALESRDRSPRWMRQFMVDPRPR